ncbi:unnamed protein product [Triticum aestivum]|uniref:Integrase catalytic domain-containing protein n=1 Tax=Triticum aestivum TaxID=4565 RepID=A0A7H4LME2_WHEAT|nr:unnamed protein product [Triticum aestivum]
MLPIVLQHVPQACICSEDHSTRLAFCCLGIGYGWTSEDRQERFHSCAGGSRSQFTKWIEAKPIKNLEASTAVSFIRELTFRYGVPHSIITNNGSNFDSDEFRAFYASQGTRVDYASVAHPQSNGQAERANGLILKGLKPRLMCDLKHVADAWVDELPSVLWGLRTTPNRSTGRTPFFLVYGAEAILLSDLLHNAPRVELFSEAKAEQVRQDAVDLLEEEREMALIRSTIYQQDLRRFHARNVRGRAFQEGDLVL